jgi:hypothetical protein
MTSPRPFPPPWSIEERQESFIVKDATDQRFAYLNERELMFCPLRFISVRTSRAPRWSLIRERGRKFKRLFSVMVYSVEYFRNGRKKVARQSQAILKRRTDLLSSRLCPNRRPRQ